MQVLGMTGLAKEAEHDICAALHAYYSSSMSLEDMAGVYPPLQ